MMKEQVMASLHARIGGTTREGIQYFVGITDPSLEEQRGRVWKLAAALASLVHDGFLVMENGLYYTQSA